MLEALRGAGSPTEILQAVRERAGLFEEAAHSVLSRHEGSSRSRVVTLDRTRRRLTSLSIQQHALLNEALDSLEHGLFRAAHVSARQAFIDFLLEKLASDGLAKVRRERPSWSKFASLDEIREEIPEYEFVQVARLVGLLSKAEMKSLHGMLSTRNQCAHPGHFRPGLNESLGYVSDLIGRIEQIQTKSL